MSPSFEDFHLSPELLQAVKDMGFEEPSPIQVLAVPFLLTGARQVVRVHHSHSMVAGGLEEMS